MGFGFILFGYHSTNLWNDNQKSNIHLIRVLKGEEKENKTRKVLKKIMTKNVPNLEKLKPVDRMQKKMADLSPSIPIIALNINDLKTPT